MVEWHPRAAPSFRVRHRAAARGSKGDALERGVAGSGGRPGSDGRVRALTRFSRGSGAGEGRGAKRSPLVAACTAGARRSPCRPSPFAGRAPPGVSAPAPRAAPAPPHRPAAPGKRNATAAPRPPARPAPPGGTAPVSQHGPRVPAAKRPVPACIAMLL